VGQGCDGAELYRPIDRGDVAVSDVDADVQPDAGDTTIETPLVDFEFRMKSGTVGLGLAALALDPLDELDAYAQLAGLQTDIAFAINGDGAEGVARLVVAGSVIAQQPVAAESSVGAPQQGFFRGVGLPIQATPFSVKIEFLRAGEVLGDADKAVTTADDEPCDVKLVTGDSDTCGTLREVVGDDGETRLVMDYSLELISGPCSELTGAITDDTGAVIAEVVGSFNDAGLYSDSFAVGAVGAPIEAAFGLAFTVIHPNDTALHLRIEGARRADNIAPFVTGTSPLTGPQTVLTVSNDLEVGVDGLQVALTAFTGSADAVEAQLAVGDVTSDPVVVPDTGIVEFGTTTFSENTTTNVRITVTDGCGNVGAFESIVDVLLDQGALGIAMPAEGATLLAINDGDRGTATIFEMTALIAAGGLTGPGRIVVTCGDTEVGALTFDAPTDNGLYLVDVALDVDVLGTSTSCVATLEGGATSGVRSFQIGLPAPTLNISSPLAGDVVCFNTTDIPVNLNGTGLNGQTISWSTAGPTGEVGPMVDDMLETIIPLAESTADGQVTILFDATDSFGNVVGSLQDAPMADIRIDRTAPQLQFNTPVDATFVASTSVDANPELSGFQVAIGGVVTDTVLAGEVCLVEVDGACSPLGDDGSWSLEVTLAPGENLVTVVAHDDCGNNSEEVARVLTLDQDLELVITSPLSDSILVAAADGDLTTPEVFDLDVTVATTGATAGDTLVIACRSDLEGAQPLDVGSIEIPNPPITDGVYVVSAAVPVATLGQRVLCRADLSGSVTATSDDIRLTLAIPAPTLVLNAPLDGACANSNTLAVTATSARLNGAELTATLADASASGTVADDAFAASLDLTALADGGPYALMVTGEDGFGNPVSAGASVLVDRSGPALTLVSPALDIDPTVTADSSTDPGFQADIVVAVADANALGGQICLTVEGAAEICATVGASTATFPAITLQPGANPVSVVASDACGNASEELAFTLTLLTQPPVVRITTPSADLVTVAETIAITATATEPGDGSASTGGQAVLLIGGVASAFVPTEVSAGVFTFADVPLVVGPENVFVVEVTREFATGTSSARTVVRKNTTPTIAIGTPTAGNVNLASTFCTNVGAGCNLTGLASTTNVEDGSAAGIAVDCGSGATSVAGTVDNNAVSFAGLVLAEASTCVLTATVTDAAGQTATSEAVTVTVDREAPLVSFVGLPNIIQATQDVDSATPGVQTALQVSASGAATGVTLRVTFAWIQGGVSQSKNADVTIIAGVTSYAIEEVVGSGRVTWPEGIVTVTASVVDAVGNQGTATRIITVNGTGSVAISAPADVANSCTTTCAVGACFQGTCWRTWGTGSSRILSVNLAGMATTAGNLRVCSDSALLTDVNGPRCATADSTTGPYRQVLLGDGVNGANILSVATALPDGYQRLVAEALPLTGGGWITSENAALPEQRRRRLFLDLIAPQVTSVTSPSDTLAPFGVLSLAEAVSNPRLFNISFNTSEAGRARIVVNDIVVRTQDVPAGASTFSVTLPEGQPNVWVIVTDAVGNTSPTTPGGGASVYQPIVDVTPPTLAFSRPTSSPRNASSDLDVVLTSDAEGNILIVFDDGIQVASGLVANGGITFSHNVSGILSDGSHRLTASVADSAGNSRTVATNPAVITVDTVAPVLNFASPANGAELQDDDDADLLASGFQLDVLFGGDIGSTTWTVLTAANCDAGFASCDAPSQAGAGAITNAGGLESAQRISAPLTAQVSRFRVIVRLADAAGNVTEEAHNVTVTTAACQVVLSNLPSSTFYNATSCTNGLSCASADLEIAANQIGFCVADTIELLVNGAVVATSPLTSFSGTFDLSVLDGATFTLQARLTLVGAPVTASAEEQRTADFTPPTVAFVAADIDGFMTPANGDNVTFNAELDLDAGTAGMQFHAALSVADLNASGGFIASVTATDGATTVDLTAFNFAIPGEIVGATPIITDLREMTLGDGATWSVVASATDAAGNPGTSSFTAVVDVTRPGSVTVSNVVFDKRRPALSPLSWTAVGDNGMTGGAVADYLVRYSAVPFDDSNWTDACDFQDIYGSDVMPAPGAPGAAMSVSLGGPDSRAFSDACKFAINFGNLEDPTTPALYVGIRAMDAAGNLSTLSSGQVHVLVNSDVQLETTRVQFDNSLGALGFTPTSLAVSGASLRDINGDGVADFGLGITLANAACVVLGHDFTVGGEVITAPTGTHHSCITPADAATIIVGTDRIGDSIVSLGDVNGDGLFDFGITGRRLWSAPYTGNPNHEAFLLIYLGEDTASPPDLVAPDVIVRGLTSQTLSAGYTSACGIGNVNGAGPEDLGFGEPSLSRLHAIPGQASWVKANGGAPVVIDLAAANAVSNAGGMTFSMTVSSGTPYFGGRCGRAGDVLSTPAGQGASDIGDLLVAQTGAENGRLFVFAGREWTAGAVVTVSQTIGVPTAEDNLSLRLRQETVGQESNSIFALDFQGGIDATGDDVPDILVGTSNRSLSASRDGKSIYVFNGALLAALVGADVRIDIGAAPLEGQSWTGTNGWVIRSDLPGRFGVVRFLASFTGTTFGSPAFEAPALIHSNTLSDEILLRANHDDPASSFELGLFPAYDGEAMSTFNAGFLSMGAFVTGGLDFTGDGAPDIITGTNFGEVLIIR